MNSKKLRIGIIGCGKIAQIRHIPEYLLNEGVEVVAVSDVNYKRAKEVATNNDIPFYFQNYRELLNMPDIDAVSVCTPNATHAEVTIQALYNQKHVLVEKPIAINIEDAEKMVNLAQTKNKILMVGYNQRLNPIHNWVKSYIKHEGIGKVYQFQSNFQHGGPGNWSIDGKNSWFFDRKEAGFGVTVDLGVHKLDLLQWLINDEIYQAQSFLSFNDKASVEDNAVFIIKTKSGILGTFSFSWNNPQQDHRTVIYGEKGRIILGESYHGAIVELNSGEVIEKELNPQLRPDGFLNSGVVDDFVQCVRTGRRATASGLEALKTMKILLDQVNGHWIKELGE